MRTTNEDAQRNSTMNKINEGNTNSSMSNERNHKIYEERLSGETNTFEKKTNERLVNEKSQSIVANKHYNL